MPDIQKANQLFLDGRFSDAILLYDLVLKEDPTNLDAINNKGYALGKLKRHLEAIAMYDLGLKTHPNEKTLLINKISSLRKLKSYQDALDNCNEILGQTPNDNIVLYHKERILHSIGEYAESIACCEIILSSYPNNSEVLFDKAISLAILQDRKTIQTLAAAIAADHNLKLKAKKHEAFSNWISNQDFVRLVSD